jgi:DNA-binding Xre family transcriptional regulator
MRLHFDTLQEILDTLRRDVNRASPHDVAEGIDMHHTSMYNFINKKNKTIKLETFVKLCDYFGYEVSMKHMVELVRRGVA